ncbi:hypothetical protein BDQ17DRAFT_1435596 [Cyathus striatus]|nr:hypothetical protein BDQ17DRAFT_1435596 [Cyathus striatus]
MDRFWTIEGFMNNCINHPDAQIVDFNILNRYHFEPKVVYHPIGKLDYDPNALITTRIPNTPGEPNTECVLYSHVKVNILNTVRNPLPKCESPYETKDTENSMGLGMFATRNIYAEDIILVEKPLLMVPFDSNLSGVPNYPEEVYHLDAVCSCHNIPAGLYEAYLQLAFGRLDQKDQDFGDLSIHMNWTKVGL